ncbi:MAG: tetratricopeptide repeat protein [Chloroflexi bacterium]|nr:tetratricopeptide repeat protein [Chloroflexota bacterium]
MRLRIVMILWAAVLLLGSGRAIGGFVRFSGFLHFSPTEVTEFMSGTHDGCSQLKAVPESDFFLPRWSLYLDGVAALLAGQSAQAEAALLGDYRSRRNPAALLLVANQWRRAGGDEALVARLPEAGPFAERDLAEYYLSLAGQCRVDDQWVLARRYLNLGLALLPPGQEDSLKPFLCRRIGEIYYYQGQYELAEPWLRRAASGGYSAALLLARILVRQQNFDEAVPLFRQSLRDYPNDMQLRLQAVDAARRAGQLGQARAFLMAVEPPEKLGVQGLVVYAQVCHELKDLPCARRQYARVIQLDPHNQEAIKYLGLENSGFP